MTSNYKSIIKSTGLIGAIQILKLAFGLLRNKLIAFYLGPAGLGVWSLYLTFTEIFQNLSNLGLDKSAVKHISEDSENLYQRSLVIQTTKYSIAFSACVFSIIILIFSEYFSSAIFDSKEYSFGFIICSLVVFFNSMSMAYSCILNGLNEIKILAKSQLIGVFIGSTLVFFLIPFFSTNAIPYYLLIIAICSFIPTFYFVNKLKMATTAFNILENFPILISLLKIGFAFWVSAVYLALTTYLINLFLKDNLSIEVVGIYQACWTISNLYIGIILSAMGVAFFPKICRAINDKNESIPLINQQIEFSLLISLPFVIVIFLYAPILLTILYSSDFQQGENIIRWQILGVIIRLFGFPFGYTLMAKGLTRQYTISQFIFSTLNFLFIIGIVTLIGFDGLGINYFLAYTIYGLLTGLACYKYTEFKPSNYLYKLVGVYIALILVSIILIINVSGLVYYPISSLIILFSIIYSIDKLKNRANFDVIKIIKSKITL